MSKALEELRAAITDISPDAPEDVISGYKMRAWDAFLAVEAEQESLLADNERLHAETQAARMKANRSREALLADRTRQQVARMKESTKPVDPDRFAG